MFVYFYQTVSGTHHICGFHKLDTAINYTLNQITSYLKNDLRPKKKKSLVSDFQHINLGNQIRAAIPPRNAVQPPRAVRQAIQNIFDQPMVIYQDEVKKTEDEDVSDELKNLIAYLEIAIKNQTYSNTLKTIELYNIYLKASIGDEPVIHTLQEIKIAG